ncbi:hypothetical protein FRC14_007827 [Serendipita sp. 396]|nr:hypothetical protein FRC14_007827 [Serendipita sp. 396]KAG8770759.1 hypothetical protein FRC15_003920 [Serendipita sp. 397]KAG8843840.1 hypothetical protein FRC20_003720 [Serendipita sp. 405]
MQAQEAKESLEDLSKYRKLGYEHVEEEKVLLDSLIVLYRKRLDVAQSHLKVLEGLYSTSLTDFDTTNSLYEPLIRPALDSLGKDIEGYRQYIHRSQSDLDKVTFPMGPHSIVQSIKEDMDIVKRSYPEYDVSCLLALNLPPPHPGGWKFLRNEEITHRMLASRLHPFQSPVRLHFETSYPQLLEDHMTYMEQVKRLMMSNATHRSELSTTIACGASTEKHHIDRFSTTDAIAVPHEKMELEKGRREWRHAPVLNPVSRRMEEDCFIILACYPDPMSCPNLAEQVVIVCLEQYRRLCCNPPNHLGSLSSTPDSTKSWSYYWEVIHSMETGQDLCATISQLSQPRQLESLICILVFNSLWSRFPLLNLTDQSSVDILQRDYWNKSALIDLMRNVHPNARRVLKACVITYFVKEKTMGRNRLWRNAGSEPMWLSVLLCTGARWSQAWNLKYGGAFKAIFRRWDCDAWCPLPDDVEWGLEWDPDSDAYLRRMKRFPARPEFGGGFVYLEVDAKGDVLDTPENKKNTVCIKKERPPSWLTQKMHKSRK